MKTVEEIYGEMMAVFAAETGLEAQGGGDLAVRLYAVAAQIYALYIQAEWVGRQCFPQTAEGERLDLHAALRGLERHPEMAAQGVIRFEVDAAVTQARAIPVGTVCMTAGLVRFETTAAAVLPVGATGVDVPAKAVQAGAAGNAPVGAVRAMAVAPVGVSRCVNQLPFTGGADREGDETLRGRVLDSFKRLPNGANAAFYEQGAMSFDQVAAAAVLPRQRGVGTVDVVVSTAAGAPSAELLAELTDYFSTRREIAVDVQVKAPTMQTVNVAIRVAAAAGRDAAAVRTAVDTAVRAYFGGELLGKSILRARLGEVIFNVAGVANYTVTAPAADVVMGPDTLPRLGTLTVEALV